MGVGALRHGDTFFKPQLNSSAPLPLIYTPPPVLPYSKAHLLADCKMFPPISPLIYMKKIIHV